MGSLRQLGSRLAGLFRRRRLEAEMAEEMRQHLERRTQEKIADGLTSQEARYAAQRDFGGVAQVQEQCRDERSLVWLEQGLQDLRYAARQLRRNPGFTVRRRIVQESCTKSPASYSTMPGASRGVLKTVTVLARPWL